jgi:hypothetical protein
MKTEIEISQLARDLLWEAYNEYWDKLCALKHYGFIHSSDNGRVLKVEGMGSHIDMYDAQHIVDQAQDRINELTEMLKEILPYQAYLGNGLFERITTATSVK